MAAAVLLAIACVVLKKKGLTWSSGSFVAYASIKSVWISSETLYHYVDSESLAVILANIMVSAIILFSAFLLVFPLTFKYKSKKLFLSIISFGSLFSLSPFVFNIYKSFELTSEGFSAVVIDTFYMAVVLWALLAYTFSGGFLLWMSTKTFDRDIKKKMRIIGTALILHWVTALSTYTYAQIIENSILVPFTEGLVVPFIFGAILYAFLLEGSPGTKLIKSFVEEFFAYPLEPTIQAPPHSFSKTLGLNHQQMAGRKMLLEFDPASNYERVIHNFVTEALANEEPIAVFTRKGSAIHSSLVEQKAVKFFCLTQRVSVPRELSEKEMLLPSSDTSLMLNVFDKMLKAHPEGVINIVFDNLSDLVLSIGFEKTYHFMRRAVEVLASPRITALFLVNEFAHGSEVVSSLRGLFGNQISFGRSGIQAVKLSETEVGTPRIEEISAKK